MKTGCVGPYCHGTGGWCGCNCNCCPPPCCPVIAVYFDCGSPQSPSAPDGCEFTTLWDNLELELPATPEIPDFSNKPIFSEDKKFTLGLGSIPCSIPCETICVELQCGGPTPCCCLELLNGTIYSVGNGYVTAPTTVTIAGGECQTGYVYINGQPPPVFVNDCEKITVTIVTDYETCCQCQQIDVQCSTCSMMKSPKRPLWKRKIDARTGKTNINPNTGKPIILLDKNELKRRIIKRIKAK